MKEKFVCCSDETTKNKLISELDLICEQEINGEKVWIFENNNKIEFNSNDYSKIKFTNKLYF